MIDIEINDPNHNTAQMCINVIYHKFETVRNTI